MTAQLHLAKDAFALHFLLQRFERLIDIVVTNQNLHGSVISCLAGKGLGFVISIFGAAEEPDHPMGSLPLAQDKRGHK